MSIRFFGANLTALIVSISTSNFIHFVNLDVNEHFRSMPCSKNNTYSIFQATERISLNDSKILHCLVHSVFPVLYLSSPLICSQTLMTKK